MGIEESCRGAESGIYSSVKGVPSGASFKWGMHTVPLFRLTPEETAFVSRFLRCPRSKSAKYYSVLRYASESQDSMGRKNSDSALGYFPGDLMDIINWMADPALGFFF